MLTCNGILLSDQLLVLLLHVRRGEFTPRKTPRYCGGELTIRSPDTPFLPNESPVHTRSADPMRGAGRTPNADASGARPQEGGTGPVLRNARYRQGL